jgi:phage shock protein A
VQKAYTQKQVLLARGKAAKAIARANEMLSRMDPDSVLSTFKRMEQKVIEKETAASQAATTIDYTKLDSEQILVQTMAALQNATEVIERMEQLLLQREDKANRVPDGSNK